MVAYYIRDGVGEQIGGWGFPHGDIGGGAWLGLELIRLLCKAIDGVIPYSPILVEIFKRFNNDKEKYKVWVLKAKASNYAEIAKLIVDYIDIDDNAKEVFDFGVTEIRKFIQRVINKTQNLPLKLVGGLSPFYLAKLVKIYPWLTVCDQSAALGAVQLVSR